VCGPLQQLFAHSAENGFEYAVFTICLFKTTIPRTAYLICNVMWIFLAKVIQTMLNLDKICKEAIYNLPKRISEASRKFRRQAVLLLLTIRHR